MRLLEVARKVRSNGLATELPSGIQLKFAKRKCVETRARARIDAGFKWLSQESFVRNTNVLLRTGGENGAPRVSMSDMNFGFASSIDLVTSRVRSQRHDGHGAVELTRVEISRPTRELFGGGEPFT